MVEKVTDATFEKDVLKATEPVVVDFWAEWCGPCRMIAPALEEISKSLNGKVKIVKLNVDPDADAVQERRAGLPADRRCAQAETRTVDHRRGLIRFCHCRA